MPSGRRNASHPMRSTKIRCRNLNIWVNASRYRKAFCFSCRGTGEAFTLAPRQLRLYAETAALWPQPLELRLKINRREMNGGFLSLAEFVMLRTHRDTDHRSIGADDGHAEAVLHSE